MPSPSPSRWGLILWGTFALLTLLIVGGTGYWQYASCVPPFRPQLPVMPVPNGYDRAVQILTRLSQVKRPPYPTKWPRGTPEQLRAHCRLTRPYLDQMRATLAMEWRSPPDLDVNDALTASAHRGMFRECARAFAAESLLAQYEGRQERALHSGLDGMEIAAQIPPGGGIIARLVAGACHAIAFRQLEQLTLTAPRTSIPGALHRVRRIRHTWPPLAEMFESEHLTGTALWMQSFREIQREPFHQQIRSLHSQTDNQSAWTTVRLALTPRRTTLANQSEYNRLLQIESRKPVRSRKSVPAAPDAWSQLHTSYDPVEFSLKYEGYKTHLALLEVALAVRMHYLETGRYPARIEEISRRWLPAVPRDMWDQPVAYRLRAGAPAIYSLGPDGRDNGGAAADYVSLNDTTRGDLVFGYLVRRVKREEVESESCRTSTSWERRPPAGMSQPAGGRRSQEARPNASCHPAVGAES